jgi:endonuclease/exonuclease/phosphatase family metal-dependent hydrolase
MSDRALGIGSRHASPLVRVASDHLPLIAEVVV